MNTELINKYQAKDFFVMTEIINQEGRCTGYAKLYLSDLPENSTVYFSNGEMCRGKGYGFIHTKNWYRLNIGIKEYTPIINERTMLPWQAGILAQEMKISDCFK
jgi:hypothetical protein